MSATIKFSKSGLQTTIQDSGRSGLRKFGIANNGCLDSTSQHIANWLVDKPKDAACLEITLVGPVIEFSGNVSIAIAGAKFELFVNDKPIESNQAIHIKNGDVLRFGKLIYGSRAYMAFAGEVYCPKVLGSLSTNLLAKFGGLNGQAMTNNSHITINSTYTPQTKKAPENFYQEFEYSANKTKIIRILTGREFDQLTQISQQNLFQNSFTVTSSSNRMALTLETEQSKDKSLSFTKPLSMITVPIMPGTIQLPDSGHPIITLADGQTTGGYPRIGQVISADLDILAQLKAGDKVTFYPVTIEKAQLIIQNKLAFIDEQLNV